MRLQSDIHKRREAIEATLVHGRGKTSTEVWKNFALNYAKDLKVRRTFYFFCHGVYLSRCYDYRVSYGFLTYGKERENPCMYMQRLYINIY